MQSEHPGPLDGINVGGGDGLPIAFRLLIIINPLLAISGFVFLIIRTLWVPADFPWRETRITFTKRDEFTHENIKGPVMVRRNGGIKQYRAMTDEEWAKSKWKRPAPSDPLTDS